jgi:CRP-like cAMP-binding protein
MEALLNDRGTSATRADSGAGRVGTTAIDCKHCAQRWKHLFRPTSRHEAELIESLKQTHLTVSPGIDILREGERSRNLFAVCDGWAVRYHAIGARSRQILDVLLPGDTAALASVLIGASKHSVQALTPARFCRLNGRRVVGLLKNTPTLALGILQARLDDESRADARLTMLGRMGAEARVGYFAMETYDRLHRRGMTNGTSCPFPLRRTDLADAVGLSKVHVLRALRELRGQNLLDIGRRDLTIPDVKRLAALTGYRVN